MQKVTWKHFTIVALIVLMFSALLGGAVLTVHAEEGEAQGTSTVKYIKNSYTSGAYLFEENGVLRYGIPISASEKEYQWEIIEHEGNFEIKNVATGNSITLRGGTGLKTSVRAVSSPEPVDLWKFDAALPSDGSQNIASASSEYKGVALHIIEIADGYVASEEIGAMLSYGEAKWSLFDESEMNFEGVIRDGFCIGYGDGYYLTADGLTFEKPTGPDDNFIWRFSLAEGGKKIYSVGQDKYLLLRSDEVSLTDEAGASVFTLFASNAATVKTGELSLVVRANGLQAGDRASASELSLVLASAVGTVLGDLKLDGVYTFSNSWFNMYMLDDNSVPTYGNSNPNNTQIQWEVLYEEESGYSALKNVGGGEYLCRTDGTLGFSKEIVYAWKMLRNSNDLYPNAVRFQDRNDPALFLHMENTNGRLECSSSVQPTWGSPHWEPVRFDAGATASMEPATVQTDTWFRLKSAYSDNLYFYQTNGGYAYGSLSVNDARGHWKFVREGDAYLLINRSFSLYVGSFGNGFLSKTEAPEEATRFKVAKYVSDGAMLIYEQNEKDYLANYLNIKNRDSLMHLSLVSVDIPETRWLIEEAPEEIETNELEVNNTVLPAYEEEGRYTLEKTAVSVEHYANYVRVKRADGKYLVANAKGKTSWKAFTDDYDTSLLFEYKAVGDDLQIGRGDAVLLLKQVKTDRTFHLKDGFIEGNRATVSVYASEAGVYKVRPHAIEDGISVSVSVDGIVGATFRTGETGEFELALHKGNNLVRFSRMDAVDRFVIEDILSNGYQGATQGITAYELEEGKTNADVEMDSREHYSMASEASGRSFVDIRSITQYVEVTLLNDMNAFTLRYSVPDTKDGTAARYTLSMYVDGTEIANLSLTNEKAHLYKEWDYTNDPEDGFHHVYFDEVTYVFDEVQPAGTVIRFRRDFDDEADYYALDLLETEIIPEAIEKPQNALSVTDYGAVADDGKDDTAALLACLDAAAKSRKEVFIPAGTFDFLPSSGAMNRSVNLTASGTVIRGAGYWYTTLKGIEFKVAGDNVSLYSMRVMGNHNTRRDTEDRGFVEILSGASPSDLTLANLWIEHYKCGAWLDYVDRVFITGNRIRYTYADGINLHAGVTDSVVENNSIRSTGDDGLAEWSDGNENTNLRLRYNTIENPWLANCIALYGGTDLYVYNNICRDTAYVGAGVNISTNFMPTNFKGELKVINNLLVRCGSDNDASGKDVGAIWFNMVIGYDAFAAMEVRGNVILNSTHQGISFNGTSIICSLILEENIISGSGSYGIDISSEFNGKMLLKNNAISGSTLEDIFAGHSERNAEVVIADDVVEIASSSGTYIALWCVGGVLLLTAVSLAIVLTVSIIKKSRRA